MLMAFRLSDPSMAYTNFIAGWMSYCENCARSTVNVDSFCVMVMSVPSPLPNVGGARLCRAAQHEKQQGRGGQ